MLGVVIPRDVKVKLHSFSRLFKGFEKIGAVRELFGEKTGRVLRDLKVEFCSSRHGYMWIDDRDGHLVINKDYLAQGDERMIYLDIIHELVHVKQFMEGKELFDDQLDYADRETELEAYGHVVQEARRIGMTDGEIFDYLKTEWMTDRDVEKMARRLGVVPQRG
ncbi:MAG: hypothetical protein QW390_05275 [Candidatus Bathyarchaeia archaeon]